jgi:hypothetical protein
MPVFVWIHAAWMILAVAVGTWSGYLGLLRATQRPDGRSPLPGRFDLRVHQWTGIAYYLMLYLGLAGGVVMVQVWFGGEEPVGIWEWHERLAIAIGALYLGAAWLGLDLLKKPAGPSRARPVAHMILNFTACTLIGIQIVLAAYAVWRLR